MYSFRWFSFCGFYEKNAAGLEFLIPGSVWGSHTHLHLCTLWRPRRSSAAFL
uniref:Uncharacterized protein n=1 Tax=Anguilla anguilla TaxID=7936 RepID=A0A0E9XFW3_ANGAN